MINSILVAALVRQFSIWNEEKDVNFANAGLKAGNA